ncbi:hypothetical protein [Kitasatospora sp. CB02891]|uniref:hypothetical protein n=1 Tax=Kitasatospora sp. CB02891 TaxID=2020329 RepID=UPI000C27DF7F|nr:hypothetical protein [Kitasatospora sp. CB02891]PJN29850.1 hypothetical protein CG736_04900 [Kitasatospora sp. CB02891]
MTSKGWGALYGLAVMAVLGWGLTGLVEAGCDWGFSRGRRQCGVPDGYLPHFIACGVAAFSTAGLGWTVIRTDDWRPSLGASAGGLVALVITLANGRSGGHLALAALEAAVVIGLPVTLRQVGRAGARRAGKAAGGVKG